MIAPIAPAAPRPKAPQGKADTDPGVQAAQDALDEQTALFNIQLAENAELQRERDAMETLMMQQLKNEDAIMKKWIEMV